jgi:hypothetical protein
MCLKISEKVLQKTKIISNSSAEFCIFAPLPADEID